MLTRFTDRRPALSAVIIALLFTVIPGAALFLAPDRTAASALVFVYALVLQLILCRKVERPILFMIPFLLVLTGLIASEIVYTLSMSSSRPGAGPAPLAYMISSVLVIVFGAEAGGVIAALVAMPFLTLFRGIWESLSRR